jgi:hypothetical protein
MALRSKSPASKKQPTKKTTRVVDMPTKTHRTFRVTRRVKPRERTKPMGAWQLFGDSLALVWRMKLLYLRVALLHTFLILIFAADRLSESGSVWLLILLVIMSLAEIWIIRQVASGETPRLKAALYRGTSQVVPYSLLLFLALVQLIPMAVGLFLFETVVIRGIAVHFWEQALFGAIWMLLSLLSYYWLMTSILALYIVTLPDMLPMSAWRTARSIVEGRRFRIGLRLLPLFIFVLAAGYGLLLVTPANWAVSYNVFWVIVAWLLPLTHTYCYKLYRALT